MSAFISLGQPDSVWMAFNPVAFESLAVAGSAVGITASLIQSSGGPGSSTSAIRAALISVETAGVRFRFDGSDPTVDEGHLLALGDYLLLWGAKQIMAIRFIQDVGAAVVKVTIFT